MAACNFKRSLKMPMTRKTESGCQGMQVLVLSPARGLLCDLQSPLVSLGLSFSTCTKWEERLD